MEMFLDLVKSLPWFGDLMIIMGVLRIVFKPIFSIIATIVDATPTESDDKLLAEVRDTKAYALVLWTIDYFASVKFPK